MENLKDLIRQKLEIEAKIKELKDEEIKFGKVRIVKNAHNPNRPICAIQLSVPYYYIGDKKDRWTKIIEGMSEKEVINQLPSIINDLQMMYDHYKESTNEDSRQYGHD